MSCKSSIRISDGSPSIRNSRSRPCRSGTMFIASIPGKPRLSGPYLVRKFIIQPNHRTTSSSCPQRMKTRKYLAIREPAMSAAADFRMMHTMIRVKNLDASIKFYTSLLGMELLRRQDFPDGKFTLAFVGYGPEASNTVVELTFNWEETDGYEIGTGFGHLALGVRDIYKVCDALEAR